MEQNYIGYIFYKPVSQWTKEYQQKYTEVSYWCNNNNAHIEQKPKYYIVVQNAPYVPTVEDYDKVLQDHLLQQRVQRGYTTREPDYYINSSVARWKQDAEDWIKHRDKVMLYGLQVQNDYQEGKPVPTIDEFKNNLPVISWTIKISEE